MVYSQPPRGLIMKTKILKNPRLFSVNNIEIKDFGKIKLDKNELISFVTKSGREYDFAAKEWGFYVTPSINGRLKKEGFKIAIVTNKSKKIFILAVEKDKINLFKKYCNNQQEKIIQWLS